MTKKMTQKEALTYVLENCSIPEDVAEKLTAMKTRLESKSVSGTKKPTKTQIANEGHKQVIIEHMEPGRLYTVTELQKEMPFTEDLSVQRVSALVKQLKDAGILTKTEDKRKSFYSLG